MDKYTPKSPNPKIPINANAMATSVEESGNLRAFPICFSIIFSLKQRLTGIQEKRGEVGERNEREIKKKKNQANWRENKQIIGSLSFKLFASLRVFFACFSSLSPFFSRFSLTWVAFSGGFKGANITFVYCLKTKKKKKNKSNARLDYSVLFLSYFFLSVQF